MRTLQQFNTTRHDFEITLETQTQIDVVPEDAETHAIPSIQYHVSQSDPCSLVRMSAQAPYQRTICACISGTAMRAARSATCATAGACPQPGL